MTGEIEFYAKLTRPLRPIERDGRHVVHVHGLVAIGGPMSEVEKLAYGWTCIDASGAERFFPEYRWTILEVAR